MSDLVNIRVTVVWTTRDVNQIKLFFSRSGAKENGKREAVGKRAQIALTGKHVRVV